MNNNNNFRYNQPEYAQSRYSNYDIMLPETHQQVFGQPSPQKEQDNGPSNDDTDKRTQYQMMNNITFSIQDLLSKISKINEQHQEVSDASASRRTMPALNEAPVSNFKMSNISTSTEDNSKSYRSNTTTNFKQSASQKRRTYEQGSYQDVSAFKERQERNYYLRPSQTQRKARETDNKRTNNLLGLDHVVKDNKKSIILDEAEGNSSNQNQQNESYKLNTLFDGKRIREIASSTIIESPPKRVTNSPVKKCGLNPFDSIIEQDNTKLQTDAPPSTQQKNAFNLSSKQHSQLRNPLTQQNQGNFAQISPSISINGAKINQNDFSGAKLQIQDFELGRCLGSGKFGDVYQAIHKKTQSLYAIKKIFKSTILEYEMVQQFTRQLRIHYSLMYPNIIKLYTHFDDEYHVFLVMEYAEGGQVMEKLNSTEKFTSNVIEQMLRAVQYMQQKKVAHRDIKPENIVLMFDDTAKLCDFGWSRIFDSDMKKTFCGTLDYVSPQMKDKGQYTLNIDIWSLGVLTFQLLCGFAPFKNQINSWKQKGSKLSQTWDWNILYPPQVSGLAESFMRNLLKENPNQRANIRTCMNHIFIKKYNRMDFNKEEDQRFNEFVKALNN